jgi:hypothetical protein
MLTTEEVGGILGISQNSVRALVEGGQLEAHQWNATGKKNDAGETERLMNRVTRRSVCVFLYRTKHSACGSIVTGMLEIYRRQMSAAERDQFNTAIRKPCI